MWDDTDFINCQSKLQIMKRRYILLKTDTEKPKVQGESPVQRISLGLTRASKILFLKTFIRPSEIGRDFTGQAYLAPVKWGDPD
jgi:hypothetical protein